MTQCPYSGGTPIARAEINAAAHAAAVEEGVAQPLPESNGSVAPSPPQQTLRPASEIPGPKPTPLLGWRGNALRFFANPVAAMTRLKNEYGPLVRLTAGANQPLFFESSMPGVATHFVFGAKATRELLGTQGQFEVRCPPGPKADVYQRLATNILFLNGQRHSQQKNLMRPWFTRNHLKRYYDDMVSATAQMIGDWRGRETINIDDEMRLATLVMSSKTLYGQEARRGEQQLAGMMSDMIHMLFSPAAMIPVDLPGTPLRRLLTLMRQIDAELWREIERKREAGYSGLDILSGMAKVHDETPEELTRDELIGEAFTLFFAGHDTAAKALTWTFFLLAQHPEVAAELHEELDRELGGDPPSFDQIFALPVLDRVIKEALRVLTPTIAFGRVAATSTSILGYEIPEGSEVIYSPHILHKDPDVFEDPKRFDPNRWLTHKPGPYEYMPFGVGHRTCLGVSYGMTQLRLVVAMILQAYRLDVIAGTRIDIKSAVVIGPKKPLDMRVTPQDRRFGDSPAPVTGFIHDMVDLPNASA
ncbi:MAG: cytochrome P450 [Acidobacteriota bacterium]